MRSTSFKRIISREDEIDMGTRGKVEPKLTVLPENYFQLQSI